jgi:hypothetical protein
MRISSQSKKVAILSLSLIAVVVIAACVHATVRQIKKARTLSSMALISVAVSRGLETKALAEINPAYETQKLFPSIPGTNHQIFDAWGNLMRVSLERVQDGVNVAIVSPGPDGKVNTKDDMVQRYFLFGRHQ